MKFTRPRDSAKPMKFESKFGSKFNHEVSGASFRHKISGANFCRKILCAEFDMKFRAQILTRSAVAKFSPKNLKPNSQNLKFQITKFKTSAASFGIPALNFKTIAASFKTLAANFKISAVNFKAPAAITANAAKAAEVARLEILKFNARAANG